VNNFLQDLFRIISNPYGNVTQRVTNAALRNTFQDRLNQTAGQIAPRAPREVSSADETVDQIVREFTLGPVGDMIRMLGAQTPQNMPLDEASTRAFVKIAERQGVTLEQIRALLEHDIDDSMQGVPGSGLARFSFRGLTDELQGVANRLSHSMTIGNLSSLFPEIEAEQSPEARRQRADAEEARAIHPAEERRTNAFLDRIFERMAGIFGGPRMEQTLGRALEKTFTYVAMRSDGVEQTGQLKGRRRGEIEERLREGGLFPTSVRESQPKQSALEKLMGTFADFMGVPGMDLNMNSEELKNAVDQLTEATQGSTTVIGTLVNRMRPLAVRAGRVAAKALRRVNRGVQRMIPARYRAGLAQLGARLGTRVATRFGVNPVVAARFGAAIGPAGVALGAMVAGASVIGSAASATYKALSALAKQSYDTTVKLANYSGVLAYANSQLQVGRVLRDIESAGEISETGKDRLNAQNRLEEAIQPWSDMMSNLGNRIGSFGANFLASTFETATEIKNTIGEGIEWLQDLIPAMKDNADAVKQDIKERRRFGDQNDAPIHQWHKQMLESPFDPARNAPRKPMGPLP
jgi:DNA-binding transcriptional MerR regulator